MRGEFRLLHKIGEGGMADVFLAERLGDDGFRTRVALKRLHRGLAMDSYFIRQLVREARLLGQLEHNNIVKVFDLRRIGDEYYVVMEYVDGIDLAAVIKVHRSRKTRIPRPFFFHVALSLTEALAYAHNAVDPSGNPTPLIHRDIKPSNVMLSRRGIVKLTDFGIAHVGDGSVTGGLVQGTANYMSPEQAFGEERLTAASDVYSLGSVFYEMLCGRPLIDGDNYLKAIHQARERRVSVEELARLGVEPGLRVVIAKMLAPDVAGRYVEMDSVRNDLQFVADRLKIDLSWHRIRAYVGRLMGILGRAPDRATLSNVAIPAIQHVPQPAQQLGPEVVPEPAQPQPAAPPPPPAPAPAPPAPVARSGPATPPTPVPRARLERSGPVTQAVQKDLLDSYIAMAALESTSEQGALPSATAQGLQSITPPTPVPSVPIPRRPTPAPQASRDPLDASTMAAPPPPMASTYAPAAPASPPTGPPTHPPTRPPTAAPHARPAPASDWGDSEHTRVYAGPSPAQSGVYGTGEMRAFVPNDDEKTRPLPGPAPLASPTPSAARGQDQSDPTRAYGAAPPPSSTYDSMAALRVPAAPRPAPMPVSPPPQPPPTPSAVEDEEDDTETETWVFDEAVLDAAAAPPPARPKRRRRKGGPAKKRKKRGGAPANLIGALIIVIVILLAVLVLLVVHKYGLRAEGPRSETDAVASLCPEASLAFDRLSVPVPVGDAEVL